MVILTVEEAQATLPELIKRLAPCEEAVLTHNGHPVAKLVGQNYPEDARPIFGRGRGELIIVSEDDDHLEGFEEYMQ